jgi:hypothetical protein
LLYQFIFQHRAMPQRTMPTTDPVMTKAKKMNKVGVKRTKRNNSVYKEKVKEKEIGEEVGG